MYGLSVIILLIAWARSMELGMPALLVYGFLLGAIIMATAHLFLLTAKSRKVGV